MFHHQMKLTTQVRQKYSAARRIFNSLLSWFHLVIKHYVLCLIYHLKDRNKDFMSVTERNL